MRVAFVGLGVMGFPMAGHLRAKGHEVTVWNRTREKALAWREHHGGDVADSPHAAAEASEIVFHEQPADVILFQQRLDDSSRQFAVVVRQIDQI